MCIGRCVATKTSILRWCIAFITQRMCRLVWNNRGDPEETEGLYDKNWKSYSFGIYDVTFTRSLTSPLYGWPWIWNFFFLNLLLKVEVFYETDDQIDVSKENSNVSIEVHSGIECEIETYTMLVVSTWWRSFMFNHFFCWKYFTEKCFNIVIINSSLCIVHSFLTYLVLV